MSSLRFLSPLLLFFTLADGLLAFIIPILIVSRGFSATEMGLLVSSANIFGAIFDFWLSRVIVNANYRRLYFLVLILAAIFPLLLWSSNHFLLYLLCMAVWGLYLDLSNFATFDFVSRHSTVDSHARDFSIISLFKSLGYLISPILAGFLISESITFFPFSLSVSFVLIAFVFYLRLIGVTPIVPPTDQRRARLIVHFSILKKIFIALWPVLIFNALIYLFDGVFWTIGPLFIQKEGLFQKFSGLLLAVYMLPAIFVPQFIKSLTHQFGKKLTAYFSFALSCLFLLPISFTTDPFWILFFVFVSSIFNSLTFPAIKAAYVDYISQNRKLEEEITGLNDFTLNLGYIFGPALSGWLLDTVGFSSLFLILNLGCIFAVLILLKVTPRHLSVAQIK